MGKASACNAGDAGDTGSIPETGKCPGGGNGKPSPVFLPREFHGQRSLTDVVQRVTESDTTEHTQAHTYN